MIFFLGLLLRLSFLFLDYSWDVNNHIAWAKDLWQRGFAGFYGTMSSEVFATVYPNYPSLSLFTFYLVYPLQQIIEKIAWVLNITFPLFPSNLIFFIQEKAFLAGMFKLPAIIADLAIAWLCYLFALRLRSGSPREFTSRGQAKNKKWALIAASLVLFNPAFFYNSSYWGQIDVIPILFVVWSFYLLLFSKRYLLSGVLFTFALLVKPTALIYLPIFMIVFIRTFFFNHFLKTLFVANIIFWLSFLPFNKGDNLILFPYLTYAEKILAAQSLPYVTNGAFNFWILITYFEGIKDTAPFIFGLSYRIIGYLITGILLGFIIRPLLQKKDKINFVFYAIFLGAFAGFLFLTKMHERYLMLPLPFLLLAAIKDTKLLKWFVVLSFISFLNMYHSWPVPKVDFIFNIISHPSVVWIVSSLNVLLFFYLLRRYIKLYG